MDKVCGSDNTLVDVNVVRRWDKSFKSGSDKQFPSLDLVRLEKWYFEGTPGRLLDYGCGSGVNLIYLLDNGYHVDGVDASSEGITFVEGKLGRRPDIRDRATLSHIQPDAVRLPFNDETFDYVVCVSVFSLLGTPRRIGRLLEEFVRVMKPGAKAILDVNGPNTDFALDGKLVEDDVYEYSGDDESMPVLTYCPAEEKTFVQLLEPHFVIDNVGYSGHKYMHSEIYEYIACVSKSA